MSTQKLLPKVWFCALMASAGMLVGCSGADNPKVAEAPAFKAPPDTAAPKIPGRKDSYGASSKYQKAMERMNTQGQGEQ